jgi:hypothetical protein
MEGKNHVSVDERLIFSRVGETLVGVLRGSAEMHFFEGSAEDVMSDLREGSKTFDELKVLQCNRYPDVEPEPLIEHLSAFLLDAREKQLVKVT